MPCAVYGSSQNIRIQSHASDLRSANSGYLALAQRLAGRSLFHVQSVRNFTACLFGESYINVCMRADIHAYMHVCIHACMHTYTQTRIHASKYVIFTCAPMLVLVVQLLRDSFLCASSLIYRIGQVSDLRDCGHSTCVLHSSSHCGHCPAQRGGAHLVVRAPLRGRRSLHFQNHKTTWARGMA